MNPQSRPASQRPRAIGPRWPAPLALVTLLVAGGLIVRQVVTSPPRLDVAPAGEAAGGVADPAAVGGAPGDPSAAPHADDDGLHGFVLSPAAPAPDVSATDAAGAVWRLADRRGKVVALFFGYTSCPDVCPQTLALLAAAKAALGDASDALDVAMITVDPQRDTPEVLARYMTGFDPSFVGLEAGEDLHAIADAFGATYARDLPPGIATQAALIAGHDEAAGDGAHGAETEHGNGNAADDAHADDDHAPGNADDRDDAAEPHGHDADVPGGFAPGSPAYTVAHSGVVFLVDPEGRLRSSYLAPFDPAELAADVRLLMERGDRSASAR